MCKISPAIYIVACVSHLRNIFSKHCFCFFIERVTAFVWSNDQINEHSEAAVSDRDKAEIWLRFSFNEGNDRK